MSLAPEAYYRHFSPQLLARVRQLWSARGLDLDTAWRAAIHDEPGFLLLALERRPQDSRPVDLLLLFDQATIWVHGLQAATGCRHPFRPRSAPKCRGRRTAALARPPRGARDYGR